MERSRCLLHWKHLDPFAAWMATRGYVREPTKGEYEVLRLRKDKDVLSFYAKAGAPEHVTAHGDGLKLAKRWLREQGKMKRAPTAPKFTPRPEPRMDVQTAMEIADDADLPDGAAMAMVESLTGLDAGEVGAELWDHEDK